MVDFLHPLAGGGGFGWSVAAATAASTSRALEERGAVVEKIGTDGSISGLHVSNITK